jgi:arabinogalactan endo-1,4-beta-galactosidase
MPIIKHLMGTGIAAATAQHIVGTISNNLTATGTTQGTALQLSDVINIVTTAPASSGVLLWTAGYVSAGDTQTVVNYGANALAIYPPVGGKLNNGTVNAAVSLAVGSKAVCTCIDGLNYFVMVG